MDKNLRRAPQVVFVVFFMTLVTVQSTLAQPNNAPDQNGTQWRPMRVRNVRPSILAWWLDPKNNPEPWEIRAAHMNEADRSPSRPKIFESEVNGQAGSAFKLDGIQAVRAIDAQNVIYALGDAAAWEKFERQVQFLDRPIPQVEIEITRVEIGEEDAVQAGWWKMGQKPTEIIKIPTSKYEGMMQLMTKAGRIKTINGPRITAMNNLPASVEIVGLQPAKVTVDTGVATKSEHAFSAVAYPDTQFMMMRKRTVTATPTVNNDGSVTLALNLAAPLYLVRGSLEDFSALTKKQSDPYERRALPELLLEKGDQLMSVINLKSDETILMADPDKTAPQTAAGNVTPDKNAIHRLIFVSARRINQNQ